MDLYLFGGAVRDLLLGVTPNDYDFYVDTELSIGEVKKELEARGYTIYKYKPSLRMLNAVNKQGRKFDFTIKAPGLFTDYTINNMFYRNGKIIDVVGGIKDVETRTLRASSLENIDGGGVIRGLRMMVQYGFTPDSVTDQFLASQRAAELVRDTDPVVVQKRLAKFSPEELNKAAELCVEKYPLLYQLLF